VGSNCPKGDFQVGIYTLVVIIVMMLAALVATKEPNDDSEFIKAPRRRKAGGYVSARPRRSLATTASASQK
jgi:hypothetical protein